MPSYAPLLKFPSPLYKGKELSYKNPFAPLKKGQDKDWNKRLLQIHWQILYFLWKQAQNWAILLPIQEILCLASSSGCSPPLSQFTAHPSLQYLMKEILFKEGVAINPEPPLMLTCQSEFMGLKQLVLHLYYRMLLPPNIDLITAIKMGLNR